MILRPFLIDDQVKDRINTLKKYANQNPFTKKDIEDVIAGKKAPAGDNENFVVFIPTGYKVVYSIEYQPCGNCRHISISVSGDGNWPNVISVNEILVLFDFTVKLGEENKNSVSHFWQDDETESLNVLEVI